MGSSNDATGRARLSGAAAVWASVVTLVVSAVLFAFGTGLSPVSELAWVAPLPVLLLAPYVATRQALTVTALSYVLSTVGSWGFYAQSSDTPLWPAGVLIIVSFAGTLALSVWIFRRLLLRGLVLPAMLIAPAVWTAVLYLISVSNPMGIMGTLATTQADVPPVVKIASITGWSGVEYFVFLVPTAIATVLSPGVASAVRVRAGVVAVAVATLAMGVGPLVGSDASDGHTRQIAVIAHNDSPWGVDVTTADGRRLVESYAGEIADLPEGTETAVLPEGAFLVDDSSLTTLTRQLGSTARAHDVTIVVGYNRKSDGEKFDSARVIPADGGAPVTYLKQHDRVSQLGDDLTYQPGTERRVGVQICLDLNFSNPSRDYAQSGTRLMLVPASDNGANGWQHSRTALLRGVENGFAVAWADRNGQPMIANSNGRVLADAHTGGAHPFTTLVADVTDGPGATVYTRLGDWFAWLAVLLGSAGIAGSFLRSRSETPAAASTRPKTEKQPAAR